VTGARAAWWRSAWAKVLAGCAAALAWGALFDQLVRTGRWVLNTAYAPTFFPLEDLHSRYLEAHRILVHGNLYRFAWPPIPPIGPDTYPPFTAYFYVPFHAIGWRATMSVWTIGNVVALAAVLAVALHRWLGVRAPNAWLISGAALAPATIVALYPFHAMLILGQMGVLTLTLVFLDLFVVPARYRGLLIGLAAAIKLLPGLFILWFLAKREIPAAIRTVAAFGVLTCFAWVMWPHASSYYWLHVLPSGRDVQMAVNPMRLPVTAATWFHGVGALLNHSLRGMLARPPFNWFGTFPWLVVAVAVLGIGAYATIRLVRADRELAAFVTLSLTTVLIAPVTWNHYWVFVGLAPILAVLEWRRDRPLAIASIVMAVATSANLGGIQQEQFPGAAGLFVFVIRNCYVLGGLVFLSVAVRSARRATTGVAEIPRSEATAGAAPPGPGRSDFEPTDR